MLKHASPDEYLDALPAQGQYVFARKDVLQQVGLSRSGFYKAIHRLSAKSRLVVLHRKVCLLVPLECRMAGAPPPTWFIDSLMRILNRPYYTSPLTTAHLRGGAHQQPQVLQDVPVMLRQDPELLFNFQ